MGILNQSLVMDVTPWPKGQGFSGSSDWWDYILTKDERGRLDNLMGAALLDDSIRTRLLKDNDGSLFTRFGISEATQFWLRSIRADSLTELAQAIVANVA